MAGLIRERHAGETVLVVSHSNTVPAIINALGGGPLEDLNQDEYDDLFVVTLTGEVTTVTRLKYGALTP
jgi:broad specificity phosphatase PhoE